MQTIIEKKLKKAFVPSILQLNNESYQHSMPKGSVSHFRLLIVSEKFVGLSKVQRQRQVYHVLAKEMAGGLHALAMQTLTYQEWQIDSNVSISPRCLRAT